MAEERSGSSFLMQSNSTYHFLKITNAPTNFFNGLTLGVPLADAAEFVTGNPLIIAEFKLDSTVPVSLSIATTLLPTYDFSVASRGRFTVNSHYQSINAIVSKLTFVSRTTGKTLASYSF